MFHRVVSDSESAVSENESFIDFVNNNVHLLDEQSASVNLSNDVIQPSVFSEKVVDEVPAVNTSTLSDSKARGKALKIDFKSMYADFHIAGNSLWYRCWCDNFYNDFVIMIIMTLSITMKYWLW